VCVCVCVHECLRVYVFVCVSLCVCVCMCECVCACSHACIHTGKAGRSNKLFRCRALTKRYGTQKVQPEDSTFNKQPGKSAHRGHILAICNAKRSMTNEQCE
jgi:hypothetical protein